MLDRETLDGNLRHINLRHKIVRHRNVRHRNHSDKNVRYKNVRRRNVKSSRRNPKPLANASTTGSAARSMDIFRGSIKPWRVEWRSTLT